MIHELRKPDFIWKLVVLIASVGMVLAQIKQIPAIAATQIEHGNRITAVEVKVNGIDRVEAKVDRVLERLSRR